MSSLDLDLTGRTALITGASRGIGAAVAQRLSAAGAHVVLAARDAAALEGLAGDLPGEATVVAADLSRPDMPLELLDAATEVSDRLDVLVNNAGISGNVPSDQLTPAMLDELLAVNVRSVLLLAGHGAARMAAAGGGSIVNVSSTVAASGVPWASAYSATKGALDAMTRSLAAEWGAQGVRVNAVRPGITRTDMTGQLLTLPGFSDFYDTQTPIGRIGEPEEVAALVAFLASDLSAYITGQAITIDGGWGDSQPLLPPQPAAAAGASA